MINLSMISRDLNASDLVELNNPDDTVFIAPLDGCRPGTTIAAPRHLLGIYLGCEQIDFSIDWVECDVFLYQERKYVMIHGDLVKVPVDPPES
jgi:hypothetical protein